MNAWQIDFCIANYIANVLFLGLRLWCNCAIQCKQGEIYALINTRRTDTLAYIGCHYPHGTRGSA